MKFMFVTNKTVNIGSNAYKIPTVLRSLHRDPGFAPISTSKNLPTKASHETFRIENKTK